jgi:integrase
MRKKANDLNALNQKMQSSHRQLGKLKGQGLHDLPLFAAACHEAQETTEMLDFSAKAPDELAPVPASGEVCQSDVKLPDVADSVPEAELASPKNLATAPVLAEPPSRFRDQTSAVQPPISAVQAPNSVIQQPTQAEPSSPQVPTKAEPPRSQAAKTPKGNSKSKGKRKGNRGGPLNCIPKEKTLLPYPLTAPLLRETVNGWSDLRPTRRDALLTAIRHAEHILSVSHDKLQGAEPWSCAGLNNCLWARAPRVYDLTKDTHRNVVSGLRYLLRRVGHHEDAGYGCNILSPAWAALYQALPTEERQRGLVLFLRFLTLSGIEPADVPSDAADRFEEWCRVKILHDDPSGMSRRAAGNWHYARQHVPGWPQTEIIRVGMRDHYAIPWSDLPASFREDAERMLTNLGTDPFMGRNPFARLAAQAKEARLATGQKCSASQPAKPRSPRSGRRALSARTIETRRDQIKRAASALILSDLPVEELTSLSVLVTPIEHPEMILHFHRERMRTKLLRSGVEVDENDLRSSNLAGIAEVLRQIAKFQARLPEADLDELTDMISLVRPEAQITMTEKNRTRLKGLLQDATYAMLLHLPWKWMVKDAPSDKLKPAEAARLAMYAASLEILLVLPLRVGNLLQLRLEHLRRPPGSKLITEIVVPARMVKNREPITWPIEPASAKLLETYLKTYRPLLLKTENPFLFPGISDSFRDRPEFASTLTKDVESVIGAEFNCHLARHFAVVRYLRKNPGAYEIAARILGHRNPETTRRFYAGLELDAAARHVNALLTQEREETRLLALGAYHRTKRRASGRGHI